MNDTAFTVDLSVDAPTLFTPDVDEVQKIVDEHIKPGQEYTLVDIDADVVGWIGSPRPTINLDEDVLVDEDHGVADPDECDSVEQLDSLVIRAKAVLRILDLATPNNTESSYGGNPLAMMRENMDDILQRAPARRAEIAQEEAENEEAERELATVCNGSFNPKQGTIEHNTGMTCPIHD